MPDSLHRRAMHRAAELLGGEEALAAVLEVNPHAVRRWIDGSLRISERVFLKVVDIVLEQEIKALRARPSAPAATERAERPA